MTTQADAADHQRMVLRETLRLAVPMHMVELTGLPPDALTAIATRSADILSTHGDDLQYGGKHCAQTFNALARGLAVAALTADGGVDFAGQHWCATPGCRATSRREHAAGDERERPVPPAEPARRPGPAETVP